jgi:NAD(P)H dehydrogenase (quinone)
MSSAQNPHGGQESTILGLYTTMMHWGSVIVAPGYTDPSLFAAGGNPYGTAHPSGAGAPGDAALAAARHQGQRLARIAARLRSGAGELQGAAG